jgi:8-oxo-dGTP diphosphatase
MSSPEPTPIAVAVVQRGDAVLIGQRPAEVPLGGLWEFPGGKLLPGETPELAAQRECREEAGLAIRILRPLDTIEHAYRHGQLRLHFFLAEPLDPDACPAEPFRWVARSDLGRYQFPPANQAVLEQLANN